ncbi:6-aminohexanoate-cyclic-dimer hydrolase, partial [Pseudomonas syringae pv. actinidiae ICMP 18807]
FAGRFGEEGVLLGLAGQLERVRPWRGRVPGVSGCGGHAVGKFFELESLASGGTF